MIDQAFKGKLLVIVVLFWVIVAIYMLATADWLGAVIATLAMLVISVGVLKRAEGAIAERYRAALSPQSTTALLWVLLGSMLLIAVIRGMG